MSKAEEHGPPRSYNVSNSILAVIAVIAMGAVLYVMRPVVLPLIIAWLLFYVLSPVLGFLKRHRVSSPLAVIVVILLLLGVFYLGGIFLYERINEVVTAYPKYQAKFVELVTTLSNRVNLPASAIGDINWTREIGTRLVAFSGSFMNFMGKTVLVLFFLVFLLLSHGQLKRKVGVAFPVERAARISRAIEDISRQIGRYLTIKLLVSLVTGILVWASLSVIGVDFPVTWGALAFFLNFIPTVGSIVAAIPPILIVLLERYPQLWPAIATALTLIGIQLAMGNLIEPKLQGDGLNLSPVVILFSLLFWGWLWGIVGMLVSVPIAASLKIVCENIEPLQPISVMMGSMRPQRKPRQTSKPAADAQPERA